MLERQVYFQSPFSIENQGPGERLSSRLCRHCGEVHVVAKNAVGEAQIVANLIEVRSGDDQSGIVCIEVLNVHCGINSNCVCIKIIRHYGNNYTVVAVHL